MKRVATDLTVLVRRRLLVFQPKRIVWCGTVAALLCLWASPVQADPNPKDSLAKYVPQDVWLFSHTWRTDGRDKLFENWKEIIAALKTCGIDQELRNAFYSATPDDKKTLFNQRWEEISTAFGNVEWVDIVCDEVVFSERLRSVVPDIILIARPKPATLEKNVNGLAAIFDLFNSYLDGKPVPAKVHGRLRTWSIESEEADIGLHMLHMDDKVALVFGQSAFVEVRSLFLGETKFPSFEANDRFKKAIQEVPNRGYAMTFLDVDRVFQWVAKLPELILGKGDLAKPIETVSSVVAAVTNQLDFMDYVVISQEVSGNKQIQHTVARVKSTCCQKPCARAMINQKPISGFAKYVPKESKSYVVSSMFDLRMIYDTILEIVRTEIPEGEQLCQKWQDVQTQNEFNIRNDLLDWVSGEFIICTLPPATPSPFGNEDMVALLRIRDPELARKKIPALVERGVTFFKNSGQELSVAPATNLPVDGFQNATIPTMVMFIGTPCFGIWDDWLVLGSSEQSIALVMKTASGEHPSITENERFIKEGLHTDAPIVGAKFADLSNIGQELSAAFFGFGFAAGMIPNEPEAAPIKAIMGSMVRLGPVVNKIDFLSSSSTLTTFKDNAWHSECVTTYKPKAATNPQ